MKRQVSICLEPELYLEIETRRGLIARATYIEAILKEALEIMAESERGLGCK